MTDFKEQGNKSFKEGDYKKALEYYSNAVEVEPNNHVHYSNRAAAYLKLGLNEEGLKDAEKSISLNDSWARGYQRKGQAEKELGKIWKGFASFSICNLLDKSNSTVESELKELFSRVQKEFQTKLITLSSNKHVANLMKDPSSIKDLMNPTAEKIFEKCRDCTDFLEAVSLVLNTDKNEISRDVENYFKFKLSHGLFNENNEKTNNVNAPKVDLKAEEAFNKANKLYVLEEYEEALGFYDIAVSHDHKNESFLLNRSACYLKTGDDVLAVEDISVLFKLGLKSPRAYYLKIEGLKRMGKNDLAKNFLEEGLKMYPQDSKLLNFKLN